MKVYLSKSTSNNLESLLEYLENKWNRKVRNDFLKKFEKKINQVRNNPKSCPESSIMKGVFKCVVTKQNTFYYRINTLENAIEIITLFDSRMDPDKLKL